MAWRDGKRASIWDVGPKWITALSGLLVALFGTGIFVGHAITPTTVPPATVNQPGSPSGLTAPTVDQPKPIEGTVVATYFVDVSTGYGISFSAERAHPVKVEAYGADLVNPDLIIGVDSSGQLAVLDAPAVSYNACKNDTRYTSSVGKVLLGEVICFTGHGVIAAAKVTNPSIMSFRRYCVARPMTLPLF